MRNQAMPGSTSTPLGSTARSARRRAGAIIFVLLASLIAAAPAAAAQPVTGRFSFTDDFIDTGGCPFAIHIVLQVQGEYQVFFNAQGDATSVMVHTQWVGTDTNLANGKILEEKGAITDTYDLVAGTQTEAGAIHLKIAYGGQGGHDRGLIVFSLADGTILIEHGQHPGADGTGAGCAAFL